MIVKNHLDNFYYKFQLTLTVMFLFLFSNPVLLTKMLGIKKYCVW